MKILIAGCGYLGKALGKSLVDLEHEVWGLRRNTLALKSLEMIGIKPIQADLLNPATLTKLPQVDYVILCQAPDGEKDDYEKTYYDGAANILAAFPMKKPKKLILVSSTSVYGVNDGSWVNEVTSTRSGVFSDEKTEKHARCLLSVEDLVLNSLIPTTVIRLAGIYGPKRNRVQHLKEGRVKPSFAETYSNRIHVDDAVAAIKLLMEKGKDREIYIGVDDKPSTQAEFYSWLCEHLALPDHKDITTIAPHPISRTSNKRCSNEKIKELGMRWKYPSFVEGYHSLLSNP